MAQCVPHGEPGDFIAWCRAGRNPGETPGLSLRRQNARISGLYVPMAPVAQSVPRGIGQSEAHEAAAPGGPRPVGEPFVQIQISTRHGHLSEESRERITAKVEKLLKIFDRLTAIEVIIDLTDSTKPKVDLMVSAEHKHDFVARHESESLMGSLDVVLHRLEQQLRKYKEKVVERHRSTDSRRRVELKPEAEGE